MPDQSGGKVVALSWPPDTNEMAQRVHAHDWAATPLGPMARWPRSLRAAVDLILGSPLAMIVLWGPDLIQIYNDAYRAIMASKHAAGLGQPTRECWPEVWHFNAPHYGAVFRGQALSLTAQKLTILRRGTPEEAFFDMTYSPLRDGPDEARSEGRILGVLVTVVEVTERVQVAAALRTSEERHRLAMQAVEAMVFDWDISSGRVERSEGLHRLLGYDPAEVEATDAWWNSRMHPEDRIPRAGTVDSALTGTDGRFSSEARMRHRDGRWVDVLDTGVIIRNGQGRVVRVVGSSVDVTARRQAERDLRESEARKAFLLTLSDAIGPLSDAEEIRLVAVQVLGRHLGANRVAYAEDRGDGWCFDVMRNYVDGVPEIVGRRRYADYGPDMLSELRAGRTRVQPDIRNDTRLSGTEKQALASARVGASLIVPLVEKGRLVAFLGVDYAVAHDFPPHEIELVKEVAERTWAAVERDRTEAALRESEARFREFGQASSDVLWIRSADSLRWEYLNPAFEAIYGLSVSKALTGDTMRNWTDLILHEDREHVVSCIESVREGEAVRFEFRIRRPDGKVRWLRNTDFPIRGPSGRVERIGGVGQDVTELKRIEAALRDNEARLRTLMEGIPQLVWRSADEGRWTWASPQWLAFTGQSQQETHGFGWLDPVHPDDRGQTMRAWAEAGRRGWLDVEYRLRRASDGAYLWHHTRALPVHGPAGEVVEWLGTTTDVQQLKELQERQAVMVAELQHRTRNLLGVVRNVARRSIKPSAGRNEYDERLATLGRVQGFLSRSSLYEVPLSDLVEAELAAVGDAASGRMTAAGPAVMLPGEGVQTVALALHELATNAVKYGALAQASGRLSVTWRVEGTVDAGDDASSRDGRLVIDWHESGVTMPDGPPARRGYGSELITQALPYQLRARTDLKFTADGVRCRIVLPAGAFTAGQV